MKHKTNLYLKLTCPRASLLLQDSSKKNKYLLTSPDYIKHSMKSKMIFKIEKPKIKESIFKLIRNTKKNQIRKDYKKADTNKNMIKKDISILNDANIDEGIVLNKYFAYLKKYNIEYAKAQELKLKQLLIPIKNQEKMIKNLKKSLNFFKTISNHMIMQYMVDSKDKFKQYMDEISTYKTRNSLSLNYNKKRFSTEKNTSLSKANDNKIILKTVSNFDDNLRYTDTNNSQNRNTISNLKLKIEDSLSIKKRDSVSSYTRNKSKFYINRRSSVTINNHRGSIDFNRKYFTPFNVKKTKNYFAENNKNNYNEELSSRSNYKTQQFKFNNN